MDALYLIFSVLATLACVAAQPMVDLGEEASEAPRNPTVGTFSNPASTDTTPLPPLVNCSTPRSTAGACVMRHTCDYGTIAIDRTLYAPRGYVKSCKEEEVCCPLESIVQQTETASQPPPSTGEDTAFEFDDDD